MSSLVCSALQAQHERPVQEKHYAKDPSFLSESSLLTADTLFYEDFDGGIGDWTIVNTDPDSVPIWTWQTETDLGADIVDDRWPIFESPTADNGFMFFKYQKYIEDINIGIVHPPYPELKGSVISPIIDMSSLVPNRKYALRFFSINPTLNIINSNVVIRAVDNSVPEAVVWSSFPDVSRPNVAAQELVLSSVPDRFVGLDSVQLVFNHSADFYGWAFDDVFIAGYPDIDIQLNDFIAIAPNYATPTAFAPGTPMSFVANIQNNGAETLDLKLAITIADSNSAVVYTDTLLYEGIRTDSLAENTTFPMTTPLPSAIGAYTGTYELFMDRIDEDFDPTNNAQSFNFIITENTFSKGNTALRTIDCCADDQDFSSGNIYYVPREATGDSLFIDNITFAINYSGFNDDDEGRVEVKTYGFREDLNQDTAPTYGDITDPTAELVELSISSFTIDTTSLSLPSDAFITVTPNEDGTSQHVPSEFSAFAVQVDYFAGNDTGLENEFAIYGPSLSYAGTELASDSTGNSRLNHLLVVPSRSIDTYGFFVGLSPIIDVNTSIVRSSSVATTMLQNDQFDVRPNPANTQFAIDFDFGISVNAQFEIINAVGQTVSAFNRDGLSSGAITIPTQGMKNGLYYVKVRTDDGQTATRKLMLNR